MKRRIFLTLTENPRGCRKGHAVARDGQLRRLSTSLVPFLAEGVVT